MEEINKITKGSTTANRKLVSPKQKTALALKKSLSSQLIPL